MKESMNLIADANNYFTFSLNNAEAEAIDCRKQQPLQRIHHVNDQTREQLKNCEGDETRKQGSGNGPNMSMIHIAPVQCS